MPSASAASVPGRGARCQSAFSAVRERKGSMTTSRAPRRRASSTNGQRCTLELTMLAPQARISRACTTASGSKPMRAADRRLVAGDAGAGADGPVEQARAERVEEAAVHAAVGEQAHVAGVRVGQDRLRPVLGGDRAQPLGDRAERLVPRDALEAPLALAAHAPQRVQQAVGAVDALEVAVHLGAEEALREAVVGVAAERDRAAVLDLHRSSRRCPGSRAGRRP